MVGGGHPVDSGTKRGRVQEAKFLIVYRTKNFYLITATKQRSFFLCFYDLFVPFFLCVFIYVTFLNYN